MAIRVSAAATDGIYTLYQWGAMGNWTDSQLVAHFLTGQEGSEAAFRVLIHRHGPMVLGVCRRVLGDEHAAEDAFQTTFLVLVKKANALRDSDLLTNWLYGVALRVASKERVKGARRQSVERRAAGRATDMDGGSGQIELRSVIDEEIRRLPERYRVPLVLCHMEGLRHDEVARKLGCPVGTVESRLSRAREQLRARLTRRGLAPSASAMAAIFRPTGATVIASHLVDATTRSATHYVAQKALVGAGSISGWAWMKRTFGYVAVLRAGAVGWTLVVAAGAGVMGLVVYRAEGEPTSRGAAALEPQSIVSQPAKETADKPPDLTSAGPREPIASAPQPIPERTHGLDKSIPKTRFPTAKAPPLTGITIDGRLDDWPKNMAKYAIANQLRDHPNYNSETIDSTLDQNAYFMVGYDPETEQIYLAVVVRDKDVVVHPTDVLKTDAVEIYIDGTCSDEVGIESPSGDWRDKLDAATMPVLQYVGVPGKVSAYSDQWDANPSLVYARTKQKATLMKYQHSGDVTTYEWSVQPFDRFPDRPTHLFRGKRLGLEVAVVDKDKNATKGSAPPTFLTWGVPPIVFKGIDPSGLGELILTGPP